MNLTGHPVRVTQAEPFTEPFAPRTFRINEASAGMSFEVSIAYLIVFSPFTFSLPARTVADEWFTNANVLAGSGPVKVSTAVFQLVPSERVAWIARVPELSIDVPAMESSVMSASQSVFVKGGTAFLYDQ